MRFRPFLAAVVLCLSSQAQETAMEADRPFAVDLPLTTDHAAVSGEVQLAPQEGGALWTLPANANGAELVYDLPALGMVANQFDELRIEFKTKESLVTFAPRLMAYPVNDMCRNWYSKILIEPGKWTTARFDLRLDDDGIFFSRKPMDAPSLTVKLVKRWLRRPGEPQERCVSIRRIQLVRYPVSIDFDPTEAALATAAAGTTWTYLLHVQNRELKALKARIRIDTSRLKHFRCDWVEKEVDLAPRETRAMPLRLSIPASVAAKVPQLYSEPVEAILDIPGTAAPTVSPLLGYRPSLLWATVPPQGEGWVPATPPAKKRERVIAAAEKALAARWGVPIHGPAGHPQSYIDASSNQNPKALSWFRHLAKDGTPIESDKVSTAYVGYIHSLNFDRANVLGQAWQLTGDVRYAVAARDVFLEYCHWYPYLPVTSPASTSGRTRLHQSTLQTCFMFAPVIDAYARIKGSPALGKADRERIETTFFRPELRAIYGHNVEYGNMQVHHYETYTHGAVALGRYWNLVGDALYGTHGFYNMIERAFTEDGLAHEAGVYHWFTLVPMMEFVEKMDEFGIDVMGPRFKRVFDGTLANTPDGVVRSGLARFYPRAYRSYRDLAYIPTLKVAKAWPMEGMSEAEAAKEEAKSVPLTANTLQPSNGYLWLREDGPQGLHALSISYIMQRDRSEFDRLHVELYDPERLSHEIFRITYGAKQAKVMYRTMAHNTVVIDRKDQLALLAKLAVFRDRGHLPAALLTEDPKANLWPGAEFARCVAILDGVFFIGDLYHQDGEHDFDWPFHAPWEPWVSKDVGVMHPSVTPDQPIDMGYDFVVETQAAKTSDPFTAWVNIPRFKAGSGRPEGRAKPYKRLHLTFAAMPDAQVITGKIPRGHRPKLGPAFFVRQPGRSTAAFGVALDSAPLDGASAVRTVERLPLAAARRAAAWRVTTTGGSYLVAINRTGKPLQVAGQRVADELLVCRLP
jgi:hypothetical protein